MPSAVTYAGKWRIKPSARLPIFLRFMINSSFTPELAEKNDIHSVIANRTYLNHMMYWPADEYNKFETEIVAHLKNNDGWFERYCANELANCRHLHQRGFTLKAIDWSRKTNQEIAQELKSVLAEYAARVVSWYCQYPLDEFFETTIETLLAQYILFSHLDFRKYVLIFTDPKEMTEVAEERWELTQMARDFFLAGENLDQLSETAEQRLNEHLQKFAYINRGLATSKPYTFDDMVNRLKELRHQTGQGVRIDELVYNASAEKIADDYRTALEFIKPKPDFQRVIDQARLHSYVRNVRVEAFFHADYGASFMYAEIARRANFNPDWIMEVSIPEMFGALRGEPLPVETEMQRRFANYAMVVKNAATALVTDPNSIKELEKEFFVAVDKVKEMQGRVACLGGIIRGPAKVCFNKNEISKVERGDILVAQFTTPDFVPAMERAAAIVADQGGLSSHAAIVSRELGVPCIIGTENGTRLIHDGDLLEVDAKKGSVKILERNG